MIIETSKKCRILFNQVFSVFYQSISSPGWQTGVSSINTTAARFIPYLKKMRVVNMRLIQ